MFNVLHLQRLISPVRSAVTELVTENDFKEKGKHGDEQ